MRNACAIVLAALVFASACAPQAVPSPSASRIAEPSPSVAPATPSASPTPTPQPTRVTPCTDRDPKANVYAPERMTLLQQCQAVTGVVTLATHQDDGDTYVQLRLDYGQEGVLSLKNLTDLNEEFGVRIVCTAPIGAVATAACGGYTSTIAIPSVGAHVQFVGALVRDNATGRNELHPAYAAAIVGSAPIAPPKAVQETKRIWADIRAKWPAVPPAIVTTDELPAGTAAAASLQADGIAHVFVSTTALLDPHNIWHEAGHVLHAVALHARGQDGQLYKPQDVVGLMYWSARGFPGAWADHLAAGEWRMLGYEALAETFAAVNLGDAERTETYGVPLDRAKMTQFFATLVSSSAP